MDYIEEKLEKSLAEMASKEDFVCFLQLLLDDYQENHSFWQNQDLHSFLTALRAYCAGEGGYMDHLAIDRAVPNWSNFAEMLCAARAFG